MTLISIIVPVFNEAENIVPLHTEINKYAPKNFELIFVDDGSIDGTFNEIERLAKKDKRVKCISFSRNFGHQNAIFAGMENACGETIIIMDGDSQDPPNMIPELLLKIDEGYDIVFTKRISNTKISFFKKHSSYVFYRLLNFLSDTPIKTDSSDFKAFNKKVHSALLQFNERQLFLRGLFNWVGYDTYTISFNRPGRLYGKTKYSISKMIGLSIQGITSFSFKPLRLALFIGLIMSFFAFSFALYALISFFAGKTIMGWTSIIITSMFLGGAQLLSIGLLGEYIAGLFIETKKRPRYLIKDKLNL